MRVIHLLRKFDPAEWGGTEMAIQRLFDGLRARGVTPVVYCPRVENQAIQDPLLDSGYRVHRYKAFVPVLGMSRQRKRQLVASGGNLMSFGLLPALWREPGVSVVHTHTLGRIGGIALTFAKQRQVPFVVTIHGGVFDLPENVKKTFNEPNGNGWEWGKVFGLVFQSHKLFTDANAIVTCNGKEAALLQARLPDKRIVVQSHAVPIGMFRQDRRGLARSAFPQIRERSVILSLGRIDPIKNQDWLLEQAPTICQRYPRALLVLAGACTDDCYGNLLQEKIRRLGLADHVLLTGGLAPGDARLVGLLQEARVLLLPSLSETFGLVILEAWAAETLVIASRTSGASALIHPGHTGWLFDLQQPQAFHECLRQAMDNPEIGRAIRKRAAQIVERDFSVEAVAGRMKQLYQEVIEEKQCVT